MSLTPSEFLGSNHSKPAVRQVYGISGSGKTTWLNEMIGRGSTSSELDPKFRVVVFDVKHDGYEGVGEVVYDWRGYSKSMNKNRVTVVHPDIDDAQDFLDDIIDDLFSKSERIDGFGATLVIEESSTYIRSTPNGVPRSIKRMATQGRSRGLSLVLVNQRALSSKWVDTQTSIIVAFILPQPDLRLVEDRWGFPAYDINDRLREEKFSFAVYDLESLGIDFYKPLQI